MDINQWDRIEDPEIGPNGMPSWFLTRRNQFKGKRITFSINRAAAIGHLYEKKNRIISHHI